MATRSVPQTYATISAAVAAAASGDTILIASGYAGNESVTVSLPNLTFDAPANVTGIVLTLASAGLKITLAGASAIRVNGTAGDDIITGNDGANVISAGVGGTDTLKGAAGNDRFLVSGIGGGAGTIDGGTGTDTVQAYQLGSFSFSNVEVLDVVTGGGTIYATTAQLGSFSSITNSGAAADSLIDVQLTGAGGTLDFTSVSTGAHEIRFLDSGLTSEVTVTGTAGNDQFGSSTQLNYLNGNLKGGGGNDTFCVDGGAGSVDGGTGTDTVKAFDLGDFSFSRVEVLDAVVDFGKLHGTTAQFASFRSMTNSHASQGDIVLNLQGAGGTLDLSTVDVGAHTLELRDDGVTAGYSFTGAANADRIYGSSYDDMLDGGAGNDRIIDSGGTDTLRGGAGDDLFVIGDGAGTIDGGTGTDTVEPYGGLGNFSFHNVEVLDVRGGAVYGQLAQVASFASIISGDDTANSRIAFYLQGAGGTLDLSTGIMGAHSAYLDTSGLTSGIAVTGTAKGDVFKISGGAGTIDGGTGTDTVQAIALGNFGFSNVEVLDTVARTVYGQLAQLASFGSITTSGSAANSQISLYLQGAGGTLDLSTGLSVHIRPTYTQGLTSGIAVTGSVNGDSINGSAYNDILDGGAGNDTLSGGAGIDLLHGGAGNDTLIGNNDGDTATYFDAGGGVRVNLATTTAQNTLSAGNDTLSGITNLIGSALRRPAHGRRQRQSSRRRRRQRHAGRRGRQRRARRRPRQRYADRRRGHRHRHLCRRDVGGDRQPGDHGGAEHRRRRHRHADHGRKPDRLGL